MESAEEVTPAVLDWLDRNAGQDDWMLYVNYWDPHTPYRAPASFGNPFAEEPLPAWLTDDVLEEHRNKVGPHSASEINMYDNRTLDKYPRYPGEIADYAGLRRMIDGYDCGIRYMDGHIGAIFRNLEQQGIMDEVAIIITADHGENMGELGIYGEHGTADQGTCRIPMIVRWPGALKGHVNRGAALPSGSSAHDRRSAWPKARSELGRAELRARASGRRRERPRLPRRLPVRPCLPAECPVRRLAVYPHLS